MNAHQRMGEWVKSSGGERWSGPRSEGRCIGRCSSIGYRRFTLLQLSRSERRDAPGSARG